MSSIFFCEKMALVWRPITNSGRFIFATADGMNDFAERPLYVGIEIVVAVYGTTTS